MSLKTVMKRLENEHIIEKWLNEPWQDTPRKPDRNLIAFFVSYCREIKGLPVLSLACLAEVSESTIERIERGEKVSDQTLDKVAVALGYETGTFTKERVPLQANEVLKNLEENAQELSNSIWIPVEPFQKHKHVRALSRTHMNIVDTSHLSKVDEEIIGEIKEYISRANFLRTEKESDLFLNREPFNKMRKLNQDILDLVKKFGFENRAYALTGTYKSVVTLGDRKMDFEIGILTFFPKDTDPYAIKRSHLLVPKCFTLTNEMLEENLN
jgi:transcriptional regulator with XRE-family HTH domain